MSAFMAVLLSVIMFFNNTFITNIKYKAAVCKSEELVKSGIYSVLSDYDYKIKEKYGLYVLYDNNTTYEDKLSALINENISYENENGILKLDLNSIKSKDIGLNNLSVLKRQILDHCKFRVPLSVIEEVMWKSESVFKKKDPGQAPGNGNNNSEEYKPDGEVSDEYEKYDMRKSAGDIMKNLTKENDSNVKIDENVYKNLPSKNMKTAPPPDFSNIISDFSNTDISDEGAGDKINQCADDLLDGGKFSFSNVYSDLLINEYILNVFNSKPYTNNEASFLKNEAEYIIFGNRTDGTNATYMYILIMLLRSAFNALYIFNDGEICSAADIAALIAAAVAALRDQTSLKNAILLGWAMVESWNDCQALVKGESVPLFKTSETWKTWIHYDKDATGTVPLTYRDYLRIFLMAVPEDVKLARILDLIQLNVSKDRTDFNISYTVVNIEVEYEVIFDGRKKAPINGKAEYGY